MSLTQQDKMIGKHPEEGIFFEWIDSIDTPCTDTKRHRHLFANEHKNNEAIELIANWLVLYHLTDNKKRALVKKKNILSRYDFRDYASELHILPTADKTKKGNLGEIILTEYLSQTTGIDVLVYKLRYNSNVDQSMKGDDVLLVDENRIFLGESKFRSTPSKKVIEEASKSMKNSLALPISLGFISDRLFEEGKDELAEKILDIQFKLSKSKLNIKNIGFVLSTNSVKDFVEKNMNSSNNDFIFISLGIENPIVLMESAFKRANDLIMEVDFDET